MEASQRATIHGPTFIRLLARLGDADVAPPRHGLSDRLSQWVDWKHAVALATALDATPAAPEPDETASPDSAVAECARVRAALAGAIAADPAFRTDNGADAPDYAFFRQRYTTLQQIMDADAAHLRARLRATLGATSAELGRLAAIDAVMERTLARHERLLMATAPNVLGQRYERLRQAAAESDEASTDWLTTFRNDMLGALLAELDVRLHPAEALLAALRPR